LRRGAIAVLFFVLALPAFAADIPVPEAKGYVNDYAGIIDSKTEAGLAALIKELQQKTTAEIAVLTVETTQPYDIFTYAMAVADKWKPGDEKKDNGLVFVVAAKDQQMYILTGYGLEGILPDARVGRIEDNYIVPLFKQGDMSAGILNGTLALAQVIAEDAGVELTGSPRPVSRAPQRRPSMDLGRLMYLAFIFFFLIPPLLGRRSRMLLPFMFLGGMGGGRSGGFGGFGGGGFGGFGGGGFGGGGAGRGW
jgi:uncharacterized protein